jgi:hypothetical protein
MTQFAIQFMDYDEGSCARWQDVSLGPFETKEEARETLKHLRATEPEDSMYAFRITEVGSEQYYSQPTDKLEY